MAIDDNDLLVSYKLRSAAEQWCKQHDIDATCVLTPPGFAHDRWKIKDAQQRLAFALKWITENT